MFRVKHDCVDNITPKHARPKIQKNDVLSALSTFSGQTLRKLNRKFINRWLMIC